MTRVTTKILQSGQPRPYADHLRVVKVAIEYNRASSSSSQEDWQPTGIMDHDEGEDIKAVLRALPVGYTDFTYPPKDREATASDYYKPRLVKFYQESMGVWYFHVVEAYTD